MGFPEYLACLAVEHSCRLSLRAICQDPPFSTMPIVRPDWCHFLHLNFLGLQGGWGLRELRPAEERKGRSLYSDPPNLGLGLFLLPPFPCATDPFWKEGMEGTQCALCQAHRQCWLCGSCWYHLSCPLSRLGSREWAESCEHSQTGAWLPTHLGTSDQPLSLPPGSL